MPEASRSVLCDLRVPYARSIKERSLRRSIASALYERWRVLFTSDGLSSPEIRLQEKLVISKSTWPHLVLQ